jgi:hypothetical protein
MWEYVNVVLHVIFSLIILYNNVHTLSEVSLSLVIVLESHFFIAEGMALQEGHYYTGIY